MSVPSTPESSRTPPAKLGFLGVLRVLASGWRRVPARPATPVQPIGLGVGSLPDGMDCLPCRVPVALVARQLA